MKKLRYIVLILILLLLVTLCFFKCKEVKGLENGFYNYHLSISERDLDHYNAVFLYNLGSSSALGSDFLVMESNAYLYCTIINSGGSNNHLWIYTNYNDVQEDINLGDSRLIECRIVFDVNSLYLIIYKIDFTLQRTQGVEPVVDGVSRTMLTRYNLSSTTPGTYLLDKWFNDDLNLYILTSNSTYTPNCLLNTAYISYSDTINDINTWSDNQLSNYLTLNKLVHSAYTYGSNDGYDDGYADGLDEGEDVGYSNGYDEGYDDGYLYGYDDGYEVGDNVGYANGYEDGEAGNNAVHPLWAMIRDIAGGIGDILALQLGPGITIGTIIFVPLFFSALGLILWIWRRN